MRALVAIPDWREWVRRLADQLTSNGDLYPGVAGCAACGSPHEFVPRYYVDVSESSGGKHSEDDK